MVDGDEVIEVQISALEHFSYCPRQCALIHVEQTYDENLYTIRGALAHERVDSEVDSTTDGVRTVRGIPLWSDRHGLIGKADAVEMRPAGPYPVEYKSGRPHGRHAAVQLCAQALCLEEMLGQPVPHGAIYYAGSRRRYDVSIDVELRAATLAIIEGVRHQLRSQTVPAAANDARCPKCSLLQSCLPAVVAERQRMRNIQALLFTPASIGPDERGDSANA